MTEATRPLPAIEEWAILCEREPCQHEYTASPGRVHLWCQKCDSVILPEEGL